MAGEGLKSIDSGGWTGVAGDAFHECFDGEPDRWIGCGQAFLDAAGALAGHAETLSWAQGQAAEAIALWERGEAATEQAKADHAAAQHQANQQAAAATAAGTPTAAPSLLGKATEFVTEFGAGAVEATIGLMQFAWQVSPSRMLVDPIGYHKDMTTLSQAIVTGVQHPSEFGKALIDYDTWKQSPGRALGHLVPDAIAVATVGAGAAATRGARGLKTVDDVTDGVWTADRASDAAADLRRVAESATPSPGQLVPGRSHVQKAQDSLRGLENWLHRNPEAPASDRLTAQREAANLRNALGEE
jgi:hypothetical protein